MTAPAPSSTARSTASPTRSAWALALGYALLLGVVDTVVQRGLVGHPETVVAWLSTNLSVLTSAPVPLRAVPSLLGSALLTEDGTGWHWLPFVLVGLVPTGQALGARPAAAVLAAVHVLATLASQVVLAWRIDHDLDSGTQRLVSDVGPSYVVVAALVFGLADPLVGVRGARWWRAGCAAALVVLAPSLFDGLTTWQVAPLGHLSSPVLVLALVVSRSQRARRARRAAAGPASLSG
jgi:hypothetical protein